MKQFKGFSPKAFEFLVAVKLNNSKAWYEQHKNEYRDYVQEPFKALISDLASAFAKVDDELMINPARCVSRIRRDTRFANDKTMYRDVMWFYIRRPEFSMSEGVGYFFEISPDGARYGMGMGFSSARYMELYRNAIRKNTDEFKKAVKQADTIKGLKISGAEYKKDRGEGLPAELKPWYNRKEIYVQSELSFQDISTPALIDILSDVFVKLKPLYDFLLSCLDKN